MHAFINGQFAAIWITQGPLGEWSISGPKQKIQEDIAFWFFWIVFFTINMIIQIVEKVIHFRLDMFCAFMVYQSISQSFQFGFKLFPVVLQVMDGLL